MLKLIRALPVALLLVFALAHPAGAQDTALRLSQMEDQMRQLLGQIETLTIELRQTKELLARQQADTEFRLNALEGGKVAAVPGAGAAPAPVPAPAPAQDAVTGAAGQTAPGPQVLGTLSVPADPAVAGAAPADPAAQGADSLLPEAVGVTGLDGTPVAPAAPLAPAALPVPDTPDGLYQQSYEALLRSQFDVAQTGFRDFLKRYPQHELAGGANYWLGESLYAQANYKDAAQVFLDGFKTYPADPKSADTLLKLGMSLNQLGQKPQACTVFQSVNVKFPKAADTRKRAQAEAKRAGCSA
jgi:tol-pal system protein YbgF